MTDERSFLDAIGGDPDDDASRLVYADWLEERGDPRAEFLRLEVALAEAAGEPARSEAIDARLDELRRAADTAWVAVVGRRYDAVLTDVRAKIPAIKAVHALFDIGLKEAKDRVESLPQVLLRGVPWPEADRVREAFAEERRSWDDPRRGPVSYTVPDPIARVEIRPAVRGADPPSPASAGGTTSRLPADASSPKEFG